MRLFESPDGTIIAKLGQIWTTDSGDRIALLVLRDADPGALVGVPEKELGVSWRELRIPCTEEIAQAHARCCVRCRRLNLGPCISATCLDLQAPKPPLDRLLFSP